MEGGEHSRPATRSPAKRASAHKQRPQSAHSAAQFRRVADTMRCSPNPVLTAPMFSLLLLEEGVQRIAQEDFRQARNDAFERRCELAQQRREEQVAAEHAKALAKMQHHATAQRNLVEQREEMLAEARHRSEQHAASIAKTRAAQQEARYEGHVKSLSEKEAAFESRMAQKQVEVESQSRQAQHEHNTLRSTLLKRRPSLWHKYVQDFARNPHNSVQHASVLDSLLFEATAKRSSIVQVDASAGEGSSACRGVSDSLQRKIAAGMGLPQLLAAAEQEYALELQKVEEAQRLKLERSNSVRSEILVNLRRKRRESLAVENGRPLDQIPLAAPGASVHDASAIAAACTRLSTPLPSAAERRASIAAKAALRQQHHEKLLEQRQLELEEKKAQRASHHESVEKRFDRGRSDVQNKAQGLVKKWQSRVAALTEEQQVAADATSVLLAGSDSPIAKDVSMHQQRAKAQSAAVIAAREEKLQQEAQAFVLKLTKHRRL